MIRVYVGIDDTDNIEAGATGQTANQLRKMIEENGWGTCEAVTRHQLLLHPDIPYTSHNSAMCFAAEIEPEFLDTLIKQAGNFLEKSSASGSDPGLCVVVSERLAEPEKLITFGYEAKTRIVTKEEAIQLAGELNIHLSEHGGDGQGIIGALAGTGLRMTGSDGRFQGRTELQPDDGKISVENIKAQSDIEIVQTMAGHILDEDETVITGEKIKTVLLEGKKVLLVYQEDGCWHTCQTHQLKGY